MSSTYGENLKLSIFGQSHGRAIGMTLDGIPAGLPVDFGELCNFLSRRAPGRGTYSTTRKERDVPEFLSGILNGRTCGAPIAAVIINENPDSEAYSNLKDCPRPGHADYAAQLKYGGFQDIAGGGHFSGRLTAPLCIAGGLCIQWLGTMGIRIAAHIYSVAGIKDKPFDSVTPESDDVDIDFPVLDKTAGEKMRRAVESARSAGDSVGGVIECAITGIPAGVGEPMFGGAENRIAQIVYGIPAVKGLEFGSGFSSAAMRGSENNDAYEISGGGIVTTTNNNGGITGGITNGMPVIFRTAIKPTPSISKEQRSVSLSRMESVAISIKGRHDPCVAPRAVPVVEAAAAIAVYDMILGNTQTTESKNHELDRTPN